MAVCTGWAVCLDCAPTRYEVGCGRLDHSFLCLLPVHSLSPSPLPWGHPWLKRRGLHSMSWTFLGHLCTWQGREERSHGCPWLLFQCANPLMELISWEDCCNSGVGAFWGLTSCTPCPWRASECWCQGPGRWGSSPRTWPLLYPTTPHFRVSQARWMEQQGSMQAFQASLDGASGWKTSPTAQPAQPFCPAAWPTALTSCL